MIVSICPSAYSTTTTAAKKCQIFDSSLFCSGNVVLQNDLDFSHVYNLSIEITVTIYLNFGQPKKNLVE